MILKTMVACILFFGLVNAAPKNRVPSQPTKESAASIPEIPVWSEEHYTELNKQWKSLDRKLASETTFSENELSEDFKGFRYEWLLVKSADEMEKLLNDSYTNYGKYSPDLKYFLAQMHIMRHLRGIVWKMRPIFEKKKGIFGGNNATHLSAVHFVRQAATGLSWALPTKQTDAMISYFTMPSAEMSAADQFKTMGEFQNFLVGIYVVDLKESISRIREILKTSSPSAVWKWDNKIFYGTASFKDSSITRIVGHGVPEMHVSIASAYEAAHDAMVFSAYDQNSLIDLAGNLGKSFGVDTIVDLGNDMGLTDEERNKIIKKLVKEKNFLSLRKINGDDYGANLMKQAYAAKIGAVEEFAESYSKLAGKTANPSMAINPGLYQKDIQNRLNAGILQMKRIVYRKEQVRDPITGGTVDLDVPKFYLSPPESLFELMANKFESGSAKLEVKNKNGDKLEYRNYFSGRSEGWDNGSWSKYVPSAKNKPIGYMMTAKRIMHYSLGAAPVFGAVDLFIR